MKFTPAEPMTTLELHLVGKNFPVILRLKKEVATTYIERFIQGDTGTVVEDGYFIPLENITFMKAQNDPV